MNEAVQIQREYYTQTASQYDDMHLHQDDEHYFALSFLSAMIGHFGIRSILDVGAGTGRTVMWLKNHFPDLVVKGVEPVDALREQGYKKGLRKDELLGGDGNKLQFRDGEFDLVCEFGVLHHVPKPAIVVGEMLRVAKKGVLISDSNNFGQGSFFSRTFKQALDAFGLWPAYNFVRTKGKRYQINEGDGLFYSYSVFNNIEQIKRVCRIVHVINTKNTSYNHYKTAEHVAVLGIKQ
jgi:ubiquinone/menaquinone biosynthesis C-methylase UbiE